MKAALNGRAVTVIAAGKAAAPMAATFAQEWQGPLGVGLVASPSSVGDLGPFEWQRAGHPVPDAGSVAAGLRALELAATTRDEGVLLVLLSGGASAALAVPARGLPLADKVEATRALLAGGIPIDDLNCVRKHLSGIKGGWLGATASAPVVTLAISDVVGPVPDDPSVIGSGPTAADPTTFEDALQVAGRLPVRSAFPAAARRVLEQGAGGERPETPKPGDPRLERCAFVVIGTRTDAMEAAAQRARELGYAVVTCSEAVVGEARVVAESLVRRASVRAATLPRPLCILSSGETTVGVRGRGRGGRNQELMLAAVEPLALQFHCAAYASVGTDGVDGPTDAAGAIVDTTTLTRSQAQGCPAPSSYLDQNDSYSFFERLGDLVRLGPTEANVADLQVMLIG